MSEKVNDIHIPDAYHPNAVELHVEEARQSAIEAAGLTDKVANQGFDALSSEEVAQVGQAMNERLATYAANVNQHSE